MCKNNRLNVNVLYQEISWKRKLSCTASAKHYKEIQYSFFAILPVMLVM